jgi:hypothetical protein
MIASAHTPRRFVSCRFLEEYLETSGFSSTGINPFVDCRTMKGAILPDFECGFKRLLQLIRVNLQLRTTLNPPMYLPYQSANFVGILNQLCRTGYQAYAAYYLCHPMKK